MLRPATYVDCASGVHLRCPERGVSLWPMGRQAPVSCWSCSILASAVSCVLFITAPAFHRMRFRRHDKAQLLRIGSRCALGGLATLAVAMVSAVFLVTEFLFGDRVAAVFNAGIAIPIGLLWWVVPALFDTQIGPSRPRQQIAHVTRAGGTAGAGADRPTAGGR